MERPRLAVFSSGTKDGGGSGFENLFNASRLRQSSGEAKPDLDAEIAVVVSNHEHGGVRERADRLGVPFEYFPGPYEADRYLDISDRYEAQWYALSGWLKKVSGLDPRRTFNIHPALLSYASRRFGGAGLYGHRVHEAVRVALEAGEISETGPTMHFTTEEFDGGPIFFERRIPLRRGMSTDEIARAVNVVEHAWQPKITDMVIHGEISWDGEDPKSLVVPKDYEISAV